MGGFPERLDISDVGDLSTFRLQKLRWPWGTIDVLVVVDGSISIDPSDPFGVARFVRVLRETTLGCNSFRVDIARRSSVPFADNGAVGPTSPRYVGYRFDSTVGGQLVLDRYDEVFLFGFEPGNTMGPDSDITAPTRLPATDSELARLTAWMNAGGGVFATGDHDFLGASMCHRVPRVATMRKWTNAQGVPPMLTDARLDTNQPVTRAQAVGLAVIPLSAETDATPQPIEWVPERVRDYGVFVNRTPHELLCHPTYGPIDVMPDHPHEGCCIERSAIDGTATVDFGGGAIAEYPEVAGVRELPKVIAYGNVVPDPPVQHAKGDVDPFRIPMIAVYDGWRAGVGRVATDSTWHHWFDMNVVGLEAASDKTAWHKISRYWLNVAKWIARPGSYRALCWWDILVSHFEYPGIEEFATADRLVLGGALHGKLAGLHGPCTVTELVLELVCGFSSSLCEFVARHAIPQFPEPDPCLTCPPFELIERYVLAGLVEGTRPIAERVRAVVAEGRTEGFVLEASEIEEAARDGVRIALVELAQAVTRSAETVAAAFGELASDGAAGSTAS